MSVAILKSRRNSSFPNLRPSVCAGLSLGEYTALYASGRLGFRRRLQLVREGRALMNEACEKTSGDDGGRIGLGAKEVEARLQSGSKGVWVANYNCPGQTVISGTKEGVERPLCA